MSSAANTGRMNGTAIATSTNELSTSAGLQCVEQRNGEHVIHTTLQNASAVAPMMTILHVVAQHCEMV
jgi:hypothetical protein